MVYQGPVKRGDSESSFREFGVSAPVSTSRPFQGPVRPGTDEKRFRRTGGGGGGSSSSQPQVFQSSLLNKSFTSREALQKAEASYREDQRREARKLFIEERDESRLKPGDRSRLRDRQLGAIKLFASIEKGRGLTRLETERLVKSAGGLKGSGGTQGRDLLNLASKGIYGGESFSSTQSNLFGPTRADLPSTPSGMFGGREITKAPTIGQQFKSFLRNREPVTGSLLFVGEKIESKFAKEEFKSAPRGQILSDTGFISSGITSAPFFIPATAPTFFVASGLGRFTPGGIRESNIIGGSISQKTGGKVSPKVGAGAVIGLSSLGLVSGAGGLAGQVRTVRGIPTTSLRTLSKQTALGTTSEGGQFARTESVIESTTKRFPGLTPRKEVFISEAITETRPFQTVKGPSDKFFISSTAVRGRSLREPSRAVDLITGKIKTERLTFGGVATSISKSGKAPVGINNKFVFPA